MEPKKQTKPLSLSEAKDQVAKKYLDSFKNDLHESHWTWDNIDPFDKLKLMEEVAELYCRSQKADAWEEGRQTLKENIIRKLPVGDVNILDLIKNIGSTLNESPVNPYKV